MIRFLLFRFWPVLLPLALYLLWYGYKRWRFRKTGEQVYLRDGPWMLIVVAMLVIAITGFIGIRLASEATGPVAYQPPVFEEGQIKEGTLHHHE